MVAIDDPAGNRLAAGVAVIAVDELFEPPPPHATATSARLKPSPMNANLILLAISLIFPSF
jgi:hypothetical protein